MNEPRTRQPARPLRPRLPTGPRWAARGLLVLPLLCLSVSAGVYCAAIYRLLHAHLVPIAEAELTRQTGHEVKIGGADFRPGALVLADVAVSNKPTFAAGNGEAALTARRLTIAYSLHSLIFDSGNAAHALSDITLEQPSALIERYPGRYNFSDFFKTKSKKAGKPFVGRILVHNGLLRFRDFEAPDRGKRPALNILASIEGTVDFFSERNIYFDVRGSGTAGRFDGLSVSGDVSRQVAGRYRGHVVATNADAAYWTDYFKAFPQARILTGRADADVTLAKLGTHPAPGLPLDLSGRIAIRRAVIDVTDKKLLRLPLENLTGTAVFTGAGVSLDARVALGGQPLAVSGTVFDFSHPQVAVTVKSSALNPIRLAQAVPSVTLPKGIGVVPGPVTADFTGAASSPTITVSGILPAVTYAGVRAANVTASATYAGKILTVPAASFSLGGGHGALRATLDTTGKRPVYLLAGAVSGINLAAFHLPPSVSAKNPNPAKNLNLGGLADVRFLLDNQNRPVTLTANIAVAKPRIRQTAFDVLQGRVAWTLGQAVTITHAALRSAHGTAAVSGTIPAGAINGRWNLSVRAAGMDLSSLLRPYSKAALGGRAAFDGKIIGPANAPEMVGAARLIEPQFERFSADFVSGSIAASLAGVRLQDVTVRRFPTLAGLNGAVTGLTSGDPKLALNVTLSQGDVSDFLQIAKEASAPSPKTAQALETNLSNLTGTAEGTFHLGGSVKSPRVYGHALIADATIGVYRIDQAAADLRYGDGVLRIENGRVKSGPATLTVHGYRTASGRIDADFAAAGLDLARFYPLTDPYAEITGTAGFTGRFFGTPQAPHLIVRALDLPDLVVNNQKFAPLTLAGRYDDGLFVQTGGPWRLIVSVPTDYAAEAGGTVEYDVNALRLALPTAAHPKRLASLALSAGIPESAPERLSHVFTTIRSSPFGRGDTGRKLLAQLARLPQPISGTFALPRLTVRGPLSALTARAELRGGDLALGETKIAGLTASLAYTAGETPDGAVTASAHDILISGIPIGAASAEADYRHRIITLHSLKAATERAYVNASGTADLDGGIAANVDASNIPLALLSAAAPKAARYLSLLPREISTLSVTASGLTRSPNFIGSVSLSNPEQPTPPSAGAAPLPSYALDRIRSGTIRFESAAPDAPKVLTLTDVAAFKDGKLIATLSGTLPILSGVTDQNAALLPDQDLHADLQVQDLSALAGFSPDLLDAKKTGGRLSASASYGGGALSGLVTITDASVGLQKFDTSANKINGIVVLADNKARIQSFTGQSSKGGSFALSGGASLGENPALNLKLAAADLTVSENSKQNLLFQKFSSALKAKINGAFSVVGPLLTPKIATAAGAPIVISDASGTLPSASNAPAAPRRPSDFDPFLDVAVQLGGGRTKTVTVTNALLKAEAGGLVTLKGRLSSPQLRADLVVTRGQFTLPPSTVLKIVKPVTGDANTVAANYPVIGPDGLPGLSTRVDIYAQATVTPSQNTLSQGRSVAGGSVGEAPPSIGALSNDSVFSGSRQRYTITAHIHGVLNSPDQLALELTSQPGGLSKQQMLAALVPASALVAGGGSNLEAGVKQALVAAALSPLTSTLGEALGLQDLNVVYDPNQPLFVTVTKQIGPRLDVTFSRSFGARGTTEQTLQPPQYTVQLGYDLTRRLRLGVSTDERKSKTVTLETVLRF